MQVPRSAVIDSRTPNNANALKITSIAKTVVVSGVGSAYESRLDFPPWLEYIYFLFLKHGEVLENLSPTY
ncbi:hypothetical protein AYI69_g3870 [Smittium culicis]|uniref:Uncharacterized protein n=1 Tax=Smittium culicis TaxID=133412 RepID=A0A1R1YIJ1_9FUNG|nr:hypothetical protein AYI69_g3870 [Smittium culicis]